MASTDVIRWFDRNYGKSLWIDNNYAKSLWIDNNGKNTSFHRNIEGGRDMSKNKIQKVIFNDPATIVYWTDGTKTVVKCMEGDAFEFEKGLAMAIAKRFLGDSFKREFKKWLPEEKTIGEAVD